MPETVNGGCPQDAVGKGVGPFRDIQVRGNDGALSLVALGDHIVEVFVLGSFQWLEAEVVNDEEIDPGQFGKLSFGVLVARAAFI